MKKPLSRIAYEAYGFESDDAYLFSGAKPPQWEDVKPHVRQRWEYVARRVAWALIDELERVAQEDAP